MIFPTVTVVKKMKQNASILIILMDQTIADTEKYADKKECNYFPIEECNYWTILSKNPKFCLKYIFSYFKINSAFGPIAAEKIQETLPNPNVETIVDAETKGTEKMDATKQEGI